MVLTEYDGKGYIAYEKKLSHDQGKDEGLKEGLVEGQFRKLIRSFRVVSTLILRFSNIFQSMP